MCLPSIADYQYESERTGDKVLRLRITLGNDSGADGKSGFDGVRDIVMHAGVRDDAGETIGTRGYVYSGADGSFLFTFTAADEPDPPCCGGGGDTEPIGPIDPDGLINTIIDNMGMEGATLAHGDLDGTTTVTTDDLILAIEWIATGELPGGAAAATSQDDDPTSGGSVNCLEAGGVDENGEPCADPDGPGGGGGNCAGCLELPYDTSDGVTIDPCPSTCPGRTDDPESVFDRNGNWNPCRNITLPDPPTTLEECTRIANCQAADATRDAFDRVIRRKRGVIRERDQAIGDAREQWQGSRVDNFIAIESPRASAEKARHTKNARARRDFNVNQRDTMGTAAGAGGACGALFRLPLPPIAQALGCLAALLKTDAENQRDHNNFTDAVQQAESEFLNDPGTRAFTNAFNQAMSTARSACATLEAEHAEIDRQRIEFRDAQIFFCLLQYGITP